MKQNQNELAIINKDDLIILIEESVHKKIQEANEALLIHLKEKFPTDEIISLEELAKRLNRSEPTVRSMAVALGITPHVYAKNKPPFYILSEVIQAMKNAGPVDWYVRDRQKFLQELDIQNNSTKIAT